MYENNLTCSIGQMIKFTVNLPVSPVCCDASVKAACEIDFIASSVSLTFLPLGVLEFSKPKINTEIAKIKIAIDVAFKPFVKACSM